MTQRPYRAVALDMDGTLLDSMPVWKNVLLEMIEEWDGVPLPQNDVEEILFPPTTEERLDWLIRHYPERASTGITVDDVHEKMLPLYQKGIPPRSGVVAFLQQMRAENIPCCVLSATPTALVEIALKASGLWEYIDFALSPDECPGGKSHPLIFEEAARRMQVPLCEMAMVDDALYSLKTARSLGIYCIGLGDEAQLRDREAIKAVSHEFYAHTLGEL